jgi:hypothetical protein
MTASYSHLPPRHCSSVSPESLICDCFSYFQFSRVAQSQTMDLLLIWWMTIALWDIGVMHWICFPVLACHTGGVAVILNPHTGFNVCGKCGLILWLDVTVCCYQDSLAYLVVVVSAFSPPWRAGVGAMDCFLLFSASLVFLCAFQLSYHLFLDSWCSFSLVLFRI